MSERCPWCKTGPVVIGEAGTRWWPCGSYIGVGTRDGRQFDYHYQSPQCKIIAALVAELERARVIILGRCVDDAVARDTVAHIDAVLAEARGEREGVRDGD